MKIIKCPKCQENFSFSINPEIIANALDTSQRFPISYLHLHNDHYIVLYVDAQGNIRGSEAIGACGDSVNQVGTTTYSKELFVQDTISKRGKLVDGKFFIV